MNAIRQFIEVKDNSFQVTLPDGFSAKRVEVIIIPDERENEMSFETKKLLDERLAHYENNPTDLIDFDECMADLEKDL